MSDEPLKLTFKEACEAVADLFEAVPETWTSGTLARNSYFQPTTPRDPDAVCWCLMGALGAALGGMSAVRTKERIRLDHIAKKLFAPYGALSVNDLLGREAAIAILREAAK